VVLEQAMIFEGDGWVTERWLDLARDQRTDRAPSGVAVARAVEPREDRLRRESRRQAALRILAARGSVTSSELAHVCDISSEQARRELAALTRLGQLRRVGNGRGSRYVLA